MHMLPIRTILHPTDFSVHSEHAYRLACSLARAYGAVLLVLHVYDPLRPDPGIVTWDPFPQGDEYWAVAEKKLHMLAAPDPRVEMEYHLAEGEPAEEILRVAREAKCDLIVMGTHGRTWLMRVL